MNRREYLRLVGSMTAASLWPALAPAQAEKKPKKKRLLIYTRSQGFEHDVVKVDRRPCLVDSIWTLLANRHGFEIECTKDGRIFDPASLARFDAIFFMTTGDLTVEKSTDGTPPMPKSGKQALLDAVAAGKGFIGVHCAADTFHSPGPAAENQAGDAVDPFIRMLGGEFISHGEQQKATMRVVNPRFPGAPSADFTLYEEWYSLKNFAPDLHVILINETAGMKNWQYARPAFPATWARMHGQGRVFYSSMGHREDVWLNPVFQELLLGAMRWTTGLVDADVTPNLAEVAPQAATMPVPPPPKPKTTSSR